MIIDMAALILTFLSSAIELAAYQIISCVEYRP